MRFGVHFIPTLGTDDQDAAAYYEGCLDLCRRADALGYRSVKIGEHYFFDYGGYCPDPVTFLSAAAQRTRRVRLVTGAVFPAFTHPIKLAGQLAMLDNLSQGRLDVGFARAFLPAEFDAFQVPLDESAAYFEEGIEAIRHLWTDEPASWQGRLYQFGPVRMLPRPLQKPHPPIWITATYTPELFEWAGRHGYHLMLVPYVSTPETVANLLGIYRQAWQQAGRPPGTEQVQLTYHCYLAEDGATARREAEPYFESYRARLLRAIEAWSDRRTRQYPGYEHLEAAVRKIAYHAALKDARLLVGSPAEVADQVEGLRARYGDHEPTLLVQFGSMPFERAQRSLALFAEHVMPRFQAPAPVPGRTPAPRRSRPAR